MPNVTFSSPLQHKDVTVYAIAGDRKTILAVAEAYKIPIPFDCKDGNCGSCLIEVVTLTGKTMGSMLTDKEKEQLKSLGKITAEEIRLAEVDDIARSVEFLLGDGGRNITGTLITIDAGGTA